MTLQKTNHNYIPSIITTNALDKLFDDAFGKDMFSTKESYPYNVYRTVDENGRNLSTSLVFALAGIQKEDISVKVEDNILEVLISPKEKDVRPLTENTIIDHRGISFRSGKFKFAMHDVDESKIQSSYNNGLLTINIGASPRTVKTIPID